MSAVAHQFNMMTETLRRGLAGIEGTKQAAKQAELGTAEMEQSVRLREEDQAYRAERATESDRRYDEEKSFRDKKWEAGADQRKVEQGEAKDTLAERGRQDAWDAEDADGTELGIDPQNYGHYAQFIPNKGDVALELKKNMDIDVVVEDGKFSFQRGGKKLTRGDMRRANINFNINSGFDARKWAAGNSEKLQTTAQSFYNPDGSLKDPSQQEHAELAKQKLQEGVEYEQDVAAHPSKYSYLKAMRGAAIFGNMVPAQQKKMQPRMDLMIAQYEADLKMDIANGRAGNNTRIVTMYDANGHPSTYSVPKNSNWGPGVPLYNYLTKNKGLSPSEKEHEKFFDPSDKEGTQAKIDEYTSKLARLEALGGLDAMTAATATPEQRRMFAGFDSAVDAQAHYKRERDRYQQYLNINDAYDRGSIKKFAKERDWSYRKTLDFFASLTEEAI
jgi:hypothetical protein